MSKNLTAFAGWPMAVLSTLAIRTALMNPPLSTPEATGWIFLAGGPVAVMLLLAYRRQNEPVEQVLYDRERKNGKGGPAGTASRG